MRPAGVFDATNAARVRTRERREWRLATICEGLLALALRRRRRRGRRTAAHQRGTHLAEAHFGGLKDGHAKVLRCGGAGIAARCWARSPLTVTLSVASAALRLPALLTSTFDSRQLRPRRSPLERTQWLPRRLRLSNLARLVLGRPCIVLDRVLAGLRVSACSRTRDASFALNRFACRERGRENN